MPRELSVGSMIGEYRIMRVLGQGGFGITYLAHDENLARDVAIKEYFPKEFAHRDLGRTVIPNQDDQDRADFDWGMKHFVEEARSLTRFKHRNIVGAIRFIRENGTAYLVMEYCDGESLESLAKISGPLPEHVLIPIVNQLVDGLEEVHRARLLHLDVKPSNIFIKKDGTVVLLDFGSARQAISSHTKSVKIASAGYGAIEQESADIESGKLGPWTDVYGLGATLYRLMTGNRPHQATARLLHDTMPPLTSVSGSGYSAGLVEAVDASLRIKPQDRPQSIAEFRALISRPESTPVAPVDTSREAESVEAAFPWRTPALVTLALIAGFMIFVAADRDAPDGGPTEASSVDIPAPSNEQSIEESGGGAADNAGVPSRCADDQGTEEFLRGTLTWDNCFGVIQVDAYKFEGLFKNGKKYEGTETYADEQSRGDRYVGRFRDGLRHGTGKYYGKNGYRYEGGWRNGLMHGFGREIGANGTRYNGIYAEGKPTGRGILIFPNGDKYEGNFKDGKFSGMGTYSWPSGAKFVGLHEDGDRKGLGTYTYEDGSKFVGMYDRDKANGMGTEYDSQGQVIRTGTWIDGEFVAASAPGNSNAATSGQTKNLYIDVKNSTGFEIRYLYVKPQGSDSWGSDRLGAAVLPSNEIHRVSLPNSTVSIFDVRACDSELDEYAITRVNAVTSNVDFNLTHLTRGKCSLSLPGGR